MRYLQIDAALPIYCDAPHKRRPARRRHLQPDFPAPMPDPLAETMEKP